ncbi:hypothetical protein M405DRAFT_845364 [Rhizopogon salebrosus TDB-379]|nr:hypothetical protein M405DRAFT_845364 [Rhizopogon salebrosus TDB-379]
MLIMGSRGLGQIKGTLLGSISFNHHPNTLPGIVGGALFQAWFPATGSSGHPNASLTHLAKDRVHVSHAEAAIDSRYQGQLNIGHWNEDERVVAHETPFAASAIQKE